MIENWKDVQIVPEFCDQGVDCYRLEGGHFLNEYYIVSEAETRKLMNHPEVVGYEVYASLVTATSQMMYYLKEKKKITSANILSILRGALNYPLEESCYKEHIRVHDISFMSSERVFENGEMTGLEIKYCKLATVPNSTLLIGDIIASGETLVNCLRYVIDYYRKQGTKLRNIVLFTIGGTQGVEILEKLTQEIRVYWPGFEGFVTVYYEGIFSCYEEGNKGVSGINRALIDFYWKGGIIAPAFRRETLSMQNPLFEKCTIYDGVLKSADRYLRFVFLTGVTKFAQISVFSDLNQLQDISTWPDYSSLCGITKEELLTTFTPEIERLGVSNGMDFDTTLEQMTKLYDGYHFYPHCEGVFNPFSVLNACKSKILDNFWFQTGTPTYL